MKKNFDDWVNELQESILAKEREIYSEKVIEHFQNPRNVGKIADADGVGKITGSCGDTMWIYLKIKDGIIDAKFLTNGCGPAIACGSMLTELVKGKTIEDALGITKDDLISSLDGLPEESVHCAALAVSAFQAAVDDYMSRTR